MIKAPTVASSDCPWVVGQHDFAWGGQDKKALRDNNTSGTRISQTLRSRTSAEFVHPYTFARVKGDLKTTKPQSPCYAVGLALANNIFWYRRHQGPSPMPRIPTHTCMRTHTDTILF